MGRYTKNRYARRHGDETTQSLYEFNATDTNLRSNANWAMAREQIKAQSESAARAAELKKIRTAVENAKQVERFHDGRIAAATKIDFEEHVAFNEIEKQRATVTANAIQIREKQARADLEKQEAATKKMQVNGAINKAADSIIEERMKQLDAMLETATTPTIRPPSPSLFGGSKPAQSVGTQTWERLNNGKLGTKRGGAISETASITIPSKSVMSQSSETQTNGARTAPKPAQSIFGAKKPAAAPTVHADPTPKPASPTSPKSSMWQVVAPPSSPKAGNAQPAADPKEVSIFWKMLGY